MPIYEYRCESCGHALEKLQKISDAPLTDCPACNQSTLKKQISAAGFRLKGSGWYETDFKKDGDKKRNLHDSGEGKSSTSTDSAASTSTSTSVTEKAAAPAAKPAAPSSTT